MLPSPGEALDVPFSDQAVRRLLVIAGGKVLPTTSELDLMLLGCRDDSGCSVVDDALRLLDGDSELVFRLGGSTVLEIGEGIPGDGTGDEPLVGMPDEVSNGRDNGSLGTEEAGE